MTFLQETSAASNIEAPALAPADESYVAEPEISREEIEAMAYALYINRGCVEGHAVEDWLEAEALLKRSRLVTS